MSSLFFFPSEYVKATPPQPLLFLGDIGEGGVIDFVVD